MAAKVKTMPAPKLSPMGRNAMSALRRGIKLAAEQSRRTGIPMAIWRNGRIVMIHP